MLAGEMVIALIIQIVAGTWVFMAMAKPNFLLLALIVIITRWNPRFIFVYACLAGLVLDVLSHSLLGVYGMSLLGVCLLMGALCARADYDGMIMPSALVFISSILYGWLSMGVLYWAIASPDNWLQMALVEVPLSAVYNILIAPFWILGVSKVERWLGRVPERNSIF